MSASTLSPRTKRRRSALLAVGAAGAAGLLWAAVAEAHHSFSMFDLENNIQIEGDVAEVQWTNPHAWVEVDVPNADGSLVRWGVEFNSPNNLTRQGWKRNDIEAGDHLLFTISPLRDGQPGGLFYDVVLKTGEIKRDPRAAGDPARQAAAAETAQGEGAGTDAGPSPAN